MSSRLVIGVLLAVVAIALIAILVVLLIMSQQSNKPLVVVTATSPATETLEPTVAAKATIFVSCFNEYVMDSAKQDQCMSTGGFIRGVSTRIP